MQINRDHLVHGPGHRIAAFEHAAAAIAGGSHPFETGRCRTGPFERDLHVVSHRTGDEQHVGMAR